MENRVETRLGEGIVIVNGQEIGELINYSFNIGCGLQSTVSIEFYVSELDGEKFNQRQQYEFTTSEH